MRETRVQFVAERPPRVMLSEVILSLRRTSSRWEWPLPVGRASPHDLGERGRGPQSRCTAIGNPGSPCEEELPQWPEHADAELRWLYSENKVPLRQLCANRMLLAMLTTKLNARLQKARQYTLEEVDERLDLLDRTGKLSPLDKTSGPQMGALVLED